jgi:negative regulator of sigma E activity
MGTDFSYADLEGRKVEEADWLALPDEKIRGEDCHVIEGVSKKSDDQYGRVRLWVHKKTMVPLRGEFFDKTGKELAKRLDVQKLQSQDGRWITTESVMETPKEGSSTRLKVASIDLKTEIPEASLTRQALER